MENNGNQIDKETLDLMKSIELGISDEEHFAITELNFYCELYGLIESLAKKIDRLTEIIQIVGQDKIVEYFKVLDGNVKEETRKQEVQKKIHADHKKPKSVAKKTK